MELHWFEGILYGFASGIAEFLPISSHAHRAILLKLFGVAQDIPLMRLLTHIGSLFGLLMLLRQQLTTLHKQNLLKKVPSTHRTRFPEPRYISEIALLKIASVPLLLSMILYSKTVSWSCRLQLVSIFSLINGFVLLLPSFAPSANKDARSTSIFDRLLIGLSSALSILPGVSRIGAITCISMVRGADMKNAYNWSLLLSIPALAAMICWDFYYIITASTGITFFIVIIAFLCGVFAFFGTWLSVSWMRSLVEKASISNFGFYSFGVAMFTFILYLI